MVRMKAKERIGIDLDDVLGDFAGAFARYYNQLHGTAFTRKDYHSHRLDYVFGRDDKYIFRLIEGLIESPHFINMPPLNGAVEGVTSLAEKYDLAVITARQDYFVDITRQWLRKNFPVKFFDIRFSANSHVDLGKERETKGEICYKLGIKTFIDDSIDYLKTCHDIPRVFLYDAPWNRYSILPQNVHRVRDWKEIEKRLV